MSRNRVSGGVIAAVLLPRDTEGRPAWSDFEHLVDFLCSHGVDGVCVNGATGEYARASQEERRTAVALARRIAGDRRRVIAGIGAASADLVRRLAADAEAAGADAFLAPPPHFFLYAEQDLAGFYAAVAEAVGRPLLLYRLPSFLSDIGPALAEDLIARHETIVGVKDSSGRLELLERLSARPELCALRLVGNDAVLAPALRRQLCDGVISGIAGVLPELITALWDAGRRRDEAALDELAGLLAEAVAWVDAWPAPMGLAVLAEIRGLCRCLPAVPLSPQRRQQAGQLRRWFEPWWDAFLCRHSTAAHPAE